MISHKFLYYTGTAVCFIGFFLAFSPHLFHSALGVLPDNHAQSIYVGIIIGLLGLGLMLAVAKKA